MVTFNFYFGSAPDFTRHHQKMTMLQQVFFESLGGGSRFQTTNSFKPLANWGGGV